MIYILGLELLSGLGLEFEFAIGLDLEIDRLTVPTKSMLNDSP